MKHLQRLGLAMLAVLAGGCSQWNNVQRDLLTQADCGVELVGTSMGEQQAMLLAEHDAKRRRLDAAYVADVRTRSLIDQDWVIESGAAHAAAIDALHERRRSLQAAHAADASNLAAIKAALARLDWLVSLQTQGVTDGR